VKLGKTVNLLDQHVGKTVKLYLSLTFQNVYYFLDFISQTFKNGKLYWMTQRQRRLGAGLLSYKCRPSYLARWR